MSEQGLVVDGNDPVALRAAIDLAVDYRGDVSITPRSGDAAIEGYVFDRAAGATPGEDVVRLFPRDGDEQVRVRVADIARIEFTGRDPAAGKSFETWMKKYVAKKLAGEQANIESEPLDG
jgi:hypothetical protein